MSYSNLQKKSIKNREQKKFIKNIADALVSLDVKLCPVRKGSGASGSLPELDINNKKLKGMYRDFIQKFIEVGELEETVLIYSVAIARKVVKEASKNYDFQKGEFILLYSACLYLSIKMLIDEERWFVADFSYVSDLDEKHIEKMEKFVAIEILKFDFKLSDDEFQREKKRLRIY